MFCGQKLKTNHTKHEVLIEFFQALNQKRRKTHMLKNPNQEQYEDTYRDRSGPQTTKKKKKRAYLDSKVWKW